MLKPLLSLCLVAAVLAGCGSVTPAGLTAAARLDPVLTPPGDLTVAFGAPDALRLRDGDVMFRLAFTPDDPAVAEPVAASVPLSVLEGTMPPRATAAGEVVYVLGFSAQNAARLSAVQQQIIALGDRNVDGKGSISINVQSGCLSRDLGDSLPVSSWLRTDPEARFVRLTRQVDLFDVLPEAERAALEAKLEPC